MSISCAPRFNAIRRFHHPKPQLNHEKSSGKTLVKIGVPNIVVASGEREGGRAVKK